MTRQAESRQLIYDGGWAGPGTFLLNTAPRHPKAAAQGWGEGGRESREGGGLWSAVREEEERPVGPEDEAGGNNEERR